MAGACSSLLPHDESRTYSPWKSFDQAQQTFDRIVPHQTTVADLKAMKLDPKANPNIAILNYSDVLRRFLPSPSINAAELDVGVLHAAAAAWVLEMVDDVLDVCLTIQWCPFRRVASRNRDPTNAVYRASRRAQNGIL